jgi:hypothetical protein
MLPAIFSSALPLLHFSSDAGSFILRLHASSSFIVFDAASLVSHATDAIMIAIDAFFDALFHLIFFIDTPFLRFRRFDADIVFADIAFRAAAG